MTFLKTFGKGTGKTEMSIDNSIKLGLCSISFRSLEPLQIIKLCKDAGLDCIEWGSDVHAKPDDKEGLENIVKLSKQYGINCSSYGTYFRIGTDNTEDIHEYISAAKMLGTDILRLWCGNKGSADYSEKELEDVYKQCKELSKIAEKENVYLCLECHIKTLTDNKESAKALVEYVGSKHFGMYFQPNQFENDDTNIAYCKWAEPYTKCVHVFNWEQKEKYPLADAKEIWQTYFEIMGDKTYLLEFMPDGEPSSLSREAKSLFEIAGR